MKKALLPAIFQICLLGHLTAQKLTISGYITDAASGEPLISATVFDRKSGLGTVSNTYGFYSLTLDQDSVHLVFSYVGYQAGVFQGFLSENTKIDRALESAIALETVEVTAGRVERIEEQTQMSKVEIPVQQLKKIPFLLGEADLIKAVQLLPGVQSGGEGQTGLYVRGGSPDQNLILLDGVPVYNISHLLGIFSVFNADAVKNVTLTKGGFPARYGGRLSSVLEINMKEGNLQRFEGEGSIGLIASRLTLQGPIWKNRTSFLVSARRTYADFIFRPFAKASARENEEIDPTLFFYDLNVKLQHRINDRHRLFASFYAGSDVFGFRFRDNFRGGSGFNETDGGIKWGNIIGALRWNYQIGPKLFLNTTATRSSYNIGISGQNTRFNGQRTDYFNSKYFTGIEDAGLRTDLEWLPAPQHTVRMGAFMTHHTYKPGAVSLKTSNAQESLDTLVGSNTSKALEYALYLEDEWRAEKFSANVGVHLSAFRTSGTNYVSAQPRLGVRYAWNDRLALKASFSTMAQYINLLTNESFSLPTDLWVPSTAKIQPQRSWQVALGGAQTIGQSIELSVEAFYKRMQNVLSYREGASFLFGLETDWQEKVVQGRGEAYGLEFLLQKKVGRFTGWLGYTLSWNNRQFDEINGGKVFPFRYDRRHDIALVASYQLNKKITLSANWVFGTGNAVTLHTYQYPVFEPIKGQNFLRREIIQAGNLKNDFRMRNYHRLDVSIAFHKEKKHWERDWVIGLYNAYSRRNPYFILPTEEYVFNPQTGQRENKTVFKQISLFPVIPSVSYNFKF